MMQLQDISNAIGAELKGGNVSIKGVTTDSRNSCSEQLFVALKGVRFDAHDFLNQAEENGAIAVMIEREIDTKLPAMIVGDTLLSLGKTAKYWRQQFDIPVIGITGSVGKTTVKQMVGSIFAQTGEGVVTQGNLNNEIGVPLTLTRLQQDDLYAVVEMGMSNLGEISRLTEMAQPTVALVNNAAMAHIEGEGLGSLQNIAQAKGEIFEGLSEDGVAIINADDEFADYWKKLVGEKRIISFGLENQADVTAGYRLTESGSAIQLKYQQQEIDIELALLGKHNVSNALAAASVAIAAGMSLQKIQKGLMSCENVSGRLQMSTVSEVVIIDDTYNANPASMRAAIDVLSGTEAIKKILIVGDMGELGETCEQAHLEVGKYAQNANIDELYACGEMSIKTAQAYGENAFWFETKKELLVNLQGKLKPDYCVLVKASRFAAMEEVVAGIHQMLTAKNVMGN